MLRLPVWAFVNLRQKSPEGYPFYFLTRGGPRTGLPLTVPIFSSRETAMKVIRGESYFADADPNVEEPFVATKMNMDQLREFLEQASRCGVEQVIVDMGTENAAPCRIAQLIDDLG